MATSYISERSAELSLVPQLKMELENHFDYVAPVFPWLNRETSKISKKIHSNDRFKILVLFPRRPKIDPNDFKNIFTTVNEDLAIFKDFAKEYNIPVIAGCPIARNFWELSKCTKHIWIEINKVTINKYLNPVINTAGKKVSASLSISRIVKLINKSSSFDIEGFSEFLHESKYVMPRSFIFGPRYKPTYLLIKNR
ncbi:MAG: hypothetical protein K9K86_10215 [Pseudomonadales bacterium]|nr:hypothetical protein [Pseudomonadales bacterium]